MNTAIKTIRDAWVVYEPNVLSNCSVQSQTTEKGRWKNHIDPIVGDIIPRDLNKTTGVCMETIN